VARSHPPVASLADQPLQLGCRAHGPSAGSRPSRLPGTWHRASLECARESSGCYLTRLSIRAVYRVMRSLPARKTLAGMNPPTGQRRLRELRIGNTVSWPAFPALGKEAESRGCRSAPASVRVVVELPATPRASRSGSSCVTRGFRARRRGGASRRGRVGTRLGLCRRQPDGEPSTLRLLLRVVDQPPRQHLRQEPHARRDAGQAGDQEADIRARHFANAHDRRAHCAGGRPAGRSGSRSGSSATSSQPNLRCPANECQPGFRVNQRRPRGPDPEVAVRRPWCGLAMTPRVKALAPVYCPRCIARRRTLVELEIVRIPGTARLRPAVERGSDHLDRRLTTRTVHWRMRAPPRENTLRNRKRNSEDRVRGEDMQ
jgi:hypothetical protein